MTNAPVNSDSDEYELEDLDDTIADYAKQQAAEDLARANEALEIDRAQKAMEERHTLDDLEFHFQFQVKHLLLLMTVVSLVFAVKDLLNANGYALLMVLTTAALIAAHSYISWDERRRFAQASERRAAAIRRSREQQSARQRGETDTIYDQPADEETDPWLADEPAEAPDENRLTPSFSMRDLLIAFTVAGVVLGLGAVLGPKLLAVVLGLAAIAGLGAYGLGVPLPASVVTVWWVTLALYLLLSIARASGLVGGSG